MHVNAACGRAGGIQKPKSQDPSLAHGFLASELIPPPSLRPLMSPANGTKVHDRLQLSSARFLFESDQILMSRIA